LLLDSQAQSLVELALKEDTGSGDITSEAIFPPGHRSTATITARENLVVCGLDLARNVFEKVDPGIDIQLHAHDGDSVESGVALLRAEGNTISLLTAERTVLNFLQHLTGIATRAREYAAAVEQSDIDVRILDTRGKIRGSLWWLP
jgi:nicotinate-nucleotide pyrophosphorylase (carboxylating)